MSLHAANVLRFRLPTMEGGIFKNFRQLQFMQTIYIYPPLTDGIIVRTYCHVYADFEDVLKINGIEKVQINFYIWK